jgi:hypothetical protein
LFVQSWSFGRWLSGRACKVSAAFISSRLSFAEKPFSWYECWVCSSRVGADSGHRLWIALAIVAWWVMFG